MLPGLPVSTRCATTRCIRRNGPRTLVLKCSSQISKVVSSKVPLPVAAAELTSPVTVPNLCRAESINRWQSSTIDTSAGTNRQSVPSACTSLAALSPLRLFRPLITIPGAPSSASLLAMASPKPWVPPVITAMVDLFLSKSSLGISEKDSRNRRRQGYVGQEKAKRTQKKTNPALRITFAVTGFVNSVALGATQCIISSSQRGD